MTRSLLQLCLVSGLTWLASSWGGYLRGTVNGTVEQSAPCGSLVIWVESGLTKEILDYVNEAATNFNPSKVIFVVYCSLWTGNGYGIESDVILNTFTQDKALPYEFWTRLDDSSPKCPSLGNKVVGQAMDVIDPSEDVTSSTVACTSGPNGFNPNVHIQRCCPGGASFPRQGHPLECTTRPMPYFLPEFYDFGMDYRPYDKVQYVEHYLDMRFAASFADHKVPMFRPDKSGSHDGWTPVQAKGWRDQDPTCGTFDMVALYLSGGA